MVAVALLVAVIGEPEGRCYWCVVGSGGSYTGGSCIGLCSFGTGSGRCDGSSDAMRKALMQSVQQRIECVSTSLTGLAHTAHSSVVVTSIGCGFLSS